MTEKRTNRYDSMDPSLLQKQALMAKVETFLKQSKYLHIYNFSGQHMDCSQSIQQALFLDLQGQLLLQVQSIPALWYRLNSYVDGMQIFEETPEGLFFLNDSPNIRLAGVVHQSSFHHAIHAFLQNVPDATLRAVIPFAWRQLSMLRLLCLEPSGMEIMQSCPLLVWLVADQVNGLDCSLYQGAALLRQKREKILDAVVGNGSKARVKLLAKLQPVKYEAKEEVMNNCVGSGIYIREVLRGVSYIYRVHKPERCTLEIRKSRNGTWQIAQLKTRSNGSPEPATRRYVESWLEEGNKGLKMDARLHHSDFKL